MAWPITAGHAYIRHVQKSERNGTVERNNFYTNGKGMGTVSHMPEGLQIPEIVYAKKTLGPNLQEYLHHQQ
jgi:hypothetical protein